MEAASNIDDLVLHEGDGKVRRPCKLTTSGNKNKIKRMPSPRKLTPTTKSTLASSEEKYNNNLLSYKIKINDGDNNNEYNSNNKKTNLNNNKSGVEELFDKVRRKVAPNNFFDEGSDADYDDDDDDSMMYDDDHNHNHDTFNNKDTSTSRRIIKQQQQQQLPLPYEHTNEDIEIYQRLDDEYERALEERDIGYNARYASIRQTAMWSVFFLLVFMAQGTYCYQELLLFEHNKKYKQSNHNIIAEGGGEEDEFDNKFNSWSIPESLFFSIFTITTVGYGREDLPTTASFQAYTIFYLLIGIAALTIMVAQVFQCIALEASRARLSQDKIEVRRGRRSGLMMISSPNANRSGGNGNNSVTSATASSVSTTQLPTRRPSCDPNQHGDDDEIIISHTETRFVPKIIEIFDKAKYFFRYTEIGKGISVIIPFAGLILSGALVVGPLEEWSFLESIYFAVVSLTTVGFGDYVPTHLASIWFCIFWLPFSIGFMSLYLGNIANFYIRLSNRNIRRIERRLRQRLEKAKEKAEKERAEVLQRAYRGQEAEIEIVAAATTTMTNRPGGSSSSSTSSNKEEKDTTGIPMNHARSVISRRRQNNARRPGFDMLPTSELDGGASDDENGKDVLCGGSTNNTNVDVRAVDTGCRRRERIIENCRVVPPESIDNDNNGGDNDNSNVALQNSSSSQSQSNDPSMKSMKDVIRAVRNTINSKNVGVIISCGGGDTNKNTNNNNNSRFTRKNMIDYSIFRKGKNKKPSFALRVLIQERFALIIAIEVAGYHSFIDIKDHTLSVTIDSMSDTADKWFIPRRARKAFRAVALEILYFVGEHGLITRGADALYELTPFEFHGLFSSLVATMGDADTMEGWLAKTDTLALVDLQRGVLQRSAPLDRRFANTDDRHRDARKRVLSNEYV